MARRGTTTYSEKIKGDRGNYDWSVGFDLTNGYLGINQFDGADLKDRVLLSPAQVKEILVFIGHKNAKVA